MKQRKSRWLAGLVCLGLIVVMAIPMTATAARTGNTVMTPPQDGRWLSFDGASHPAPPDLALLGSDSSAIDLQADLPGCLAEDVEAEDHIFTRLYGEGYGNAVVVGLPNVPVLRQAVEIPFGAEVELEIIDAQFSDHTLSELGLHPIYPLQPPVPKIPGAGENMPFEIDSEFYASGALYPEEALTLGEEYVTRGHRIQTVEVWPVAYDPTVDALRMYSEITFRLKLTGSDMVLTWQVAERYASPAFESSLSDRVLNYNQGRPPVEFGPEIDVGYLIITADAYHDPMLPFVALREGGGFDVTMTKLSDIPGGGSNVAIKAYIQDAYDNWPTPPSYVLLVGDTDTMPGWDSEAAWEITDLYYATMDGGSDWHPDIGRGRFPVRSAAQTTIMVDKYVIYAGLTGQEPWLKQASFIATCDRYWVAEGTHNYVIQNYTEPNGYTGIFPTDPMPGGDRLYCITHHATASDIQTSLNQGRWVAIYSGHGSWTGWEMGYGQDDVQSLINAGMYPFVASHSCITGDFDRYEVFGETWVLQEAAGALVFWGSSDSSYWDEDDVLERAMFDSLFAEVTEHADVTTMTYDGLAGVEASYPSMARYYWETYNVLGDPAVKIFLEPDQPPESMHVHAIGLHSWPYSIGHLLYGGVRVVDGNSQVVPGATVSAEWTLPNGAIRARDSVTNNYGGARFWTWSLQTGIFELCVTDVNKAGYIYDPDQNNETCDTIQVP
jgi:hypothetical protein